jgi:hypothetical protein
MARLQSWILIEKGKIGTPAALDYALATPLKHIVVPKDVTQNAPELGLPDSRLSEHKCWHGSHGKGRQSQSPSCVKGQFALDDRSCPILFVRARDLHGSTMFHQISPFLKCKLMSSPGSTGRSVEAEMNAPGLGVLNVPGPTNIQFFMLAGPAQARDVALIASNALAITIVDPATLPTAWGPEVDGLAVSLVLDKNKYSIGEEVPLRVNIENFRAALEIGSGELPCFAGLSIEVRDSAGSIVPSHEPSWMCTGHGWQTRYPVGKQVYVRGLTLSASGELPLRPGDYSVTVTWNAGSFSGQPNGFGNQPLQPYATVHSQTVKFCILDGVR